MRIVFSIFLLIGCSSSSVVSVRTHKTVSMENSPSDSELIPWDTDVKLVWDDFQGRQDGDSHYKAVTYTRIASNPISYSSDSIEYDIVNYFIRELSWSKDKVSQALLTHEKVHFDISELVTRKIRRAYTQHDLNELEITYIELSALFNKFGRTEKDSLNLAYDSETKHGTIAVKQKEWEKKIERELKELDNFSSTKVIVRRPVR